MKLLVVSHPCVTPINQQFYARVEAQTGWELTLVVPSRWRNEYREIDEVERWPEFQGRLLQVPVWKSGNLPLHTYRDFLRAKLKELKPEAIYVHHEPYAVATAQVYLANRLSLNCPFGYYSAQNLEKRYPIPFRWWERRILRRSAFAFPVSREVQRVLRHKGAVNTTLLPLAIDSKVYRPTATAGANDTPAANRVPVAATHAPPANQEHFNGSRDVPVIGYVGRISREKGVATLLRALPKLAAAEWQALFIGAGPMETEVDAAAAEWAPPRRVRRLGYVPHHEIAGHLSALDVLVVPSETQSNWKEQFGRVIIEALACGTPVLGSDSGEIPHLIQTTAGGLTFSEGDPQALAKQLDRLLADPQLRRRYAERGRREVLSRFTVDRCAQVFAKTIEASVHQMRADG